LSARILVIMCHPALEHSRVNQRLIFEAQSHAHTVVHDLYERYPDFHINVKWEQEHLTGFDAIVFQHPLYWYSCPSLMKEWMDLVLSYHYAYGPNGYALAGKRWCQVVSAGGNGESYTDTGMHQAHMDTFLMPFKMTATFCQMHYRSPLIIYNAHKISSQTLEAAALEYKAVLDALAEQPALSASAQKK
jgi:glutathione-regulated potassium-efflux system ancillary protein KefG